MALVVAADADAAEWTAEVLALPAPVGALRQVDAAVYVKAGGWLRLSACAEGAARACAVSSVPPAASSAPDGIPGGAIATAAGAGIGRAWYTRPTDRYDHGVLGDRIEAGGLAVVAGGRRHDLRLGSREVFEDLTPRIADLDRDGDNEVVVIRSSLDTGAALAVYGVRGGALVEIAATPPIGRPRRWLNVAGIADFTGDGRRDVAIVKTPHIGGRLEFWTLRSGDLALVATAEGFSNHAIGSSELGLSAIADVDGDGIADLALPDAGRMSLRIISAKDGTIRQIDAVGLSGPVATAIGVLSASGDPAFVLGLADGKALVVHR